MEDISSIKATIASCKTVADSVAEILADGKVDFKDISQVPELITEVRNLLVSIKGIKAEAQDIDAAELKEVLTEALDLVLYIAAKFGVQV